MQHTRRLPESVRGAYSIWFTVGTLGVLIVALAFTSEKEPDPMLRFLLEVGKYTALLPFIVGSSTVSEGLDRPLLPSSLCWKYAILLCMQVAVFELAYYLAPSRGLDLSNAATFVVSYIYQTHNAFKYMKDHYIFY